MEFLALGVVAAVLSGMFGIGGGVVIVPLLMLVAGMKPEMATGTSLASLLLPVGARPPARVRLVPRVRSRPHVVEGLSAQK